MPANRFSQYAYSTTAPAMGSYPITPSDTVDLPEVIRAVTIGVSGTLAWRGVDGVDYQTATLPVGDRAIHAVRILSTGTTASEITDWA